MEMQMMQHLSTKQNRKSYLSPRSVPAGDLFVQHGGHGHHVLAGPRRPTRSCPSPISVPAGTRCNKTSKDRRCACTVLGDRRLRWFEGENDHVFILKSIPSQACSLPSLSLRSSCFGSHEGVAITVLGCRGCTHPHMFCMHSSPACSSLSLPLYT